MCIVCEIKSALKAAGVEHGAAEGIVAKANKLVEVLGVVLDKVNDVRERDPDAFTPAEVEAIDRALSEVAPAPVADALAVLLGALFGGAVVNTVRVEVGEGESINDAIARTLAGNEASSKAFTKH